MAFSIRMVIVVFGSLTTILLGIKEYRITDEKVLSAIALCLSAVIPIFSAWEAFFDHRWLWLRYTSTLDNLYTISDELEYVLASGKPAPKEQLDSFHQRMQAALQETGKE